MSIINTDMHIHSRQGLEDFGNFVSMIELGIAGGITTFGFLEHGDRISKNHQPILVNSEMAFRMKESVERLRNIYSELVIYFGIEIDYSQDDQFRKKTLKYLQESDFDFVIGSIHSMKLESNQYYLAVIDMIESYPISIIGHMKLFDDYQNNILLEKILLLCANKKIIIEINTSNRAMWESDQLQFMIERMKKYGVDYIFGSDAHKIEEVGQNYENLRSRLSR